MRILTFFLSLAISTIACAQRITGVVVDATTGDSIAFATVYYRGHNTGGTCDASGTFNIERHEGWTLYVTSVGYKEQQITITAATPKILTIKMQDETRQLSAVVVKSKKRRYSRKNNPAVELMKRVVAQRDSTRLENHDYYQYTKYQKISFALNDYTVKSDSAAPNKFNWMANTEVSPYNNKVILPLSVNETVLQHVYRRSPRSEKDIVEGLSSTGINDLVSTGDMVNTLLKEVFQDVNIYDDYVRLLQFPFPSPIGSHAVAFYHFYIQDTLYVDKEKCIHLRFFPNNQQDFGFNGDLYVLADSTLHVKKCSLVLPKKSDVNYVQDMHIEQTFTQLYNGEWVLTNDDMWAEMTVLKKQMLVVRNTQLSNYDFEQIGKQIFKGKAHQRVMANARSRDEKFWDIYRASPLTQKESSMNMFIDQLKRYKGLRVPLFLFRCFAENYIETGTVDTPSKFDIGPMMSTFSSNFVDGFRTRLSSRTTGALSHHWFWNGYYAHGFKSHGNYYGTSLTYSFNRKKNTPFEFPQRTLSFESSYDVMSPSDKFLINDKDNILLGIRTEKVDQMYFYNRQKLTFIYETDYGLNLTASLKTERDEVAGTLHFIHLNDGTEQQTFRTTEGSIGLTYTPGQTYVNMKQMRLPVNLDSPEYTIKHTMGISGLLGGQYRMNQTEIGIYKRQWLGSWGRIDMHLNAAAQWNKLPFPLLMTPPIDLSYIEQEGTFNMLHNMEFFMDRKVFWSLSWNMNGKVFNRIPLLHKLKWREYIGFKGIWGKMTDKNNPTLASNAADDKLFQLPEGSYIIDSSRPYMEVLAGIHNIFKFFSVEWVHRLSYNDHPNTHKDGIRFGLEMTF